MHRLRSGTLLSLPPQPPNSEQSLHFSNPPKPRLTLRVGITGHRPNKLPAAIVPRITSQLSVVFRTLDEIAGGILHDDADAYAKESAVIRLVSGFAEGADQMAVLACPGAWQIDALLPFP